MRRRLVEGGVEPWLVTATANADLDRLAPVQLSLIADVVSETAVMRPVAEQDFGRLARLHDDCTPDEVASLMTFVRGELVESGVGTGGWDGAA